MNFSWSLLIIFYDSAFDWFKFNVNVWNSNDPAYINIYSKWIVFLELKVLVVSQMKIVNLLLFLELQLHKKVTQNWSR